jgi:pimeloyl-ACP methyl ester carboxylesterase
VRATLTPVVLAALLAVLAGCGGGGGGGGGSAPAKQTVEGPLTRNAKGVWIFRPAGEPKRLVIFFHGQGGPVETTPANHREWIDHLVKRGAAVVYPRYELSYSDAVLDPAVAGVRTARDRLDLKKVPVVALGYSRGAALAVEYAAVARHDGVPVPDAVESVNPVPYGEQARIVNLRPLRPNTIMAVLISDQDPNASDGAALLINRLREAGFPGRQVQLNIARSHGSFVADHLAPLGSSPAARAAYWAPTDELLRALR